MVNTSLEYRKALYEDKRSFIPKVNILLSSGAVLELSGSQIMQGGVKIDDGVSSPGSFDIGAAVIGKLTLNINNIYDEYSDYNFTDAVVTVFAGLQLESRIEWLKKGVFSADDPTSTQSIITLECLDNMVKFDKQYDGKLSFPANLQTIVNYCCSKCGVILNTTRFDNYTYRVEKSPFGESPQVTYREILAYCAQIAGCYARCNTDGRLELKWFDSAVFPALNEMDGGNLVDYSGTNVDGGNFINYNSGDSADGGEFSDKQPYHHVYSMSSLKITVDDVAITGISVTATDGKNAAGETLPGETVLDGSEGYVLKIESNPLVEYGKALSVANYLGAKIRGMKFRPLETSCLSDPSIEAGDCAIVTDRKNNSYYCFITNLSYTMGGYEILSCDAETPARNSSQKYDQITKAAIKAREEAKKEISSYDIAVQQLNSLALNSLGYYETITREDDGSMIKYMHDKPEMKDSKVVYKRSIDGFFISLDGGANFKSGFDKYGNAVLNVIAAIGINADWIEAGRIKSIDIEGSTITGSTFKNTAETFQIDNDGLLRSYSKSKKTDLSLGNAGITVSGRISEEPGVRESYGLRCIDYANKRGASFNSSGIYMYIDRGAGLELDTVFDVDLVERYMYCYCDATFFYPFTIFNDLYVSGKITTNGLVNNSDPRLKDIESHITNAESLLKKLETIIFRWKDGDDKKLHMGLNADNVQEVFGDEYGIVTEGREGYKGVSYIEIIPLLVSAVNSHSERLERIEKKLDKLLQEG